MISPFTARDLERLRGIHPDLVARLEGVFAARAAAGDPMFVVVGRRTAAEQAALYRKGRGPVPGPIVTNCDGIRHPSPHQPRADGFGHAVDCAFVVPLRADPFALSHNWEAYGEALEAVGLVWGGRFHHPVDLDHAELP